MKAYISISNGRLEFEDFQLQIDHWADCEGLHLIDGPNGSGKSSLLRVILGLSELQFGKRASPLASEELGYVPQNYRQALFPWASGIGNLNRFRGIDTESSIDRLIELGVSRNDLRKKPGALSGGQCQRLVIVRELALKPKVLVLDEPFSSLDTASAKRVATYLSDFIETGTRIVITSHQTLPNVLEKHLNTISKIERFEESKARVTSCVQRSTA